MTTWKLTLTPPGGPITEKTNLTDEQTLAALADLVYGTPADFAPAAVAAAEPQRHEELMPVAA